LFQKIEDIFGALNKSYFIKSNYCYGKSPNCFVDTVTDVVYHPDIYQLLPFLSERFECEYIIDINCGDAKELIESYPNFKIISIDYRFYVYESKNKYRWNKWIYNKKDDKINISIPVEILKKSIIVVSDVIEHLVSPKQFLIQLKKWMNLCPICLITTSGRNLVRSKDDIKLTSNPTHVREWNILEMEKLLKHYGFNVAFLGLTVSNDKYLEKKTILSIINKNDDKIMTNNDNLDNFKVIAIMTAYNEEDIIQNSIMKLYKQGIGVYVIDNWSIDSTGDIIDRLNKNGFLVGCEKFPPSGPTKYYEWKKLLSRVEDLTTELDANWFIHHDVDEVRESPWKGVDLKKGIYLADINGYNAIDHTVIEFRPIDNSFTEGIDYEEYFKYFELSKISAHFCQIKAWKNLRIPISLASSGGHDVFFKDRKVYPYKFLIKHYPIRSQNHGEKKVFRDRQSRWSPEEKMMGWHVHYDDCIQGKTAFIKKETDLIKYDDGFHRKYLVERISGIGIVRNSHYKN
jgi:hypothetical protein